MSIKDKFTDEEIRAAVLTSKSKKEARKRLNSLNRGHISRQVFDYWLEKSKNPKFSNLKKKVQEHQTELINNIRSEKQHESEKIKELREGSFKSILVISDLHAPYNHRDALLFLSKIKDKFKPDLIINVGDELDNHAISFHDTDPDLMSAGAELKQARAFLHKLNELFPEMYIANSNHTSLNYRRSKKYGMSKELILPYRDLIFGERKNDSVIRPNNRGAGWHWADSFIVRASDGSYFKVKHGDGSLNDNTAEINANRISVVRGHYHSNFDITYSASEFDLLWCMTTGWLGDDDSLAFAYNKKQAKRPINGCGVILNGKPRLIPMNLHKGRWIGELDA